MKFLVWLFCFALLFVHPLIGIAAFGFASFAYGEWKGQSR